MDPTLPTDGIEMSGTNKPILTPEQQRERDIRKDYMDTFKQAAPEKVLTFTDNGDKSIGILFKDKDDPKNLAKMLFMSEKTIGIKTTSNINNAFDVFDRVANNLSVNMTELESIRIPMSGEMKALVSSSQAPFAEIKQNDTAIIEGLSTTLVQEIGDPVEFFSANFSGNVKEIMKNAVSIPENMRNVNKMTSDKKAEAAQQIDILKQTIKQSIGK